MEELVRTFLFQNKSYVGDQEWLTLLSWQHPQLFHHLPCNFNFQEPYPDFPRDQNPKWVPYFHCEGEILVLHRPWTLDSPLPSPRWKTRIQMIDPLLNLPDKSWDCQEDNQTLHWKILQWRCLYIAHSITCTLNLWNSPHEKVNFLKVTFQCVWLFISAIFTVQGWAYIASLKDISSKHDDRVIFYHISELRSHWCS